MHYEHICASHALEVQIDEYVALELWNRSMHQGVSTYAHCRWDCASSYLSAAFEIASIRLTSSKNSYFNVVHVLKPLEFLLEIRIFEQEFSQAVALLAKATQLIARQNASNESVAGGALRALTQKLSSVIEQKMDEGSAANKELVQRCEELLNPVRGCTMH